METLSIKNLGSSVKMFANVENVKDLDEARFANTLYTVKQALKQLKPMEETLKKIIKKFDITSAESKTSLVTAEYKPHGMRWDSDKLNAHFAKQGLNPDDFKSESTALFISVKQK